MSFWGRCFDVNFDFGERRMNNLARTTRQKRELGAKIAAIEGLMLSSELVSLFEKFDIENRSPVERIKLLHEHFDTAYTK
jgi:hypothetical protein